MAITGSGPLPLVLTGLGLVLIGVAFTVQGRERRRRTSK